MSDLELLHFEQLKKEVQAQYLKSHTPSVEDISKWKGIDIIYFQEDLRKLAKSNISEKTFYTYFKNSPVLKLPRIDMLNLLSIYAGYASWYDFKKNHLFANEILEKLSNEIPETLPENLERESEDLERKNIPEMKKDDENLNANPDLQNNYTENKNVKENNGTKITESLVPKQSFVKRYLWLAVSGFLAILAGVLGFKDSIFKKEFHYNFVDSDRNAKINTELQVKILKEGESPFVFIAKPNEEFVYTTKSKSLKMVVSSPYYKTQEITRNLETAPEKENIELIPNDYAIMLFYYSKSINDLKKKRESLNYLISDNALIYQIYDNEKYGVETMDKQRYISLVTLPTTSLENLQVIETQTDKNKKINLIKFRIANNENSK